MVCLWAFYLLDLSPLTFYKLVLNITKISFANVLDNTIVSNAYALFFKRYAVALTVSIPRISLPSKFLEIAFYSLI
jgi:hypothetical protein